MQKYRIIDTCTLSRYFNLTGSSMYGNSLLDVCKRLFDVDLDSKHKTAMRKLCIQDATAGHEQEISEYCLSDIQYLPKIVETYEQVYKQVITGAAQDGSVIDLSGTGTIIDFDSLLDRFSDNIKASQKIVDVGIPVNVAQVDDFQAAAEQYIKQFYRDMQARWQCFRETKDGRLSKNLKRFYELLQDSPLPRTALTNRPCMDKDTLKTYFKCSQDPRDFDASFGHWLYYLSDRISVHLHGVASGQWLKNLNRQDSRIHVKTVGPDTARTLRWQAKPSEGYVPQWYRPLRALIRAHDRVIAELDYASEETAIFGAIFRDENYMELYNSEDPYLHNAIALGLLAPNKTSKSKLTPDELKVRAKVKGFSLAWQYGAGAKTLARAVGVTERVATTWKRRLDQHYRKASDGQKALVKLFKSHTFSVLIYPDGMPVLVHEDIKATTLNNIAVQGTGACILRNLVKTLQSKDVSVFATVHDAVWVELKPDQRVEDVLKLMRDEAFKWTGVNIRVSSFTLQPDEEPKCEEESDTQEYRRVAKCG